MLKRKINIISLGLVVGSLWIPAWSAGAVSNVLENARFTAGARIGSDVQEYFADAIVPLQERASSAWFFNLRGTFLEDLEQELNAGLVYRQLLPERNVIVSGNAYYDTRWTENDNTFDQLGAGVEVLSEKVDARVNYYHPLDDVQTLMESSSTDVSNRGNVRVSRTTLTRVYEEALQGVDAEVGVWIPALAQTAPTALFVGYYDFSSDFSEDFSGFKLRVESRVHANVTLDAEWFEDEALNRTEYFAGVRFTLPFGGKKAKAGNALQQRMDEMVQRDFRIRTIKTGPVVADIVVEETVVRSSGSNGNVAPAPSSSGTPATATTTRTTTRQTTPTPPANCRLDSEGEVICD